MGIPDEIKEEIFKKCIEACKEINYVSAGTFEFLSKRTNFTLLK